MNIKKSGGLGNSEYDRMIEHLGKNFDFCINKLTSFLPTSLLQELLGKNFATDFFQKLIGSIVVMVLQSADTKTPK